MITKSVSRTEALVSLSNLEVIFLQEVVKMYEQKQLGDIDDSRLNKIKKEIGNELDEIWKRMNPS